MSFRAAVLALALLSAQALGAQDQKGTDVPPGEGAPPTQTPPQARPELPIVHAILVEGEQRYSEAQLISALGQKVGERLDPTVIDRATDSLWRSFHVRVQSVAVKEVVPAAGGSPAQVDVLLLVVEMPSDREPRFIGNVDIDTKTLKKWALIEDRVEMFEYQAARVRQRLLEGYKREGYFWAEVDVVKHDMAEGASGASGTPVPMMDVIFDIREGPLVRVKDIEIQGNLSMPNRGFGFWKDGLTPFASPQLSEPWFFNWLGSAFVQETLDADVLAMRNVYRERGWLDAQVESELHWNTDRSEVRIKILIDEGKPYIVDDVKVEFFKWVLEDKPDPKTRDRWAVVPAEDAPRFSAEELLAKCELKKGKQYEEITQNRDKLKLRDFYGEKGHLSHPSLPKDLAWEFLEPELFFKPQEHKLRVTYRIVEGHPLTLREISFAGTHHTRDEVLRREVSVFPGGKADQKEIIKSLTRIQGTNYFSDQFSPETHYEPTYQFLEVPGSKELIDLEYQVEEGRVVEFQLAGGVDSNDGAFGLISLSLRNFDITDLPSKWNRTISELFRKEALHGGGQLLQFQVSPGTKVSSASVRFLEPDIFGMYLEPISLDLSLKRQLHQYRTHEEDRFDKAIKFGKRFGFDTYAAIGLVHTDLEIIDVQTSGAPASLTRQERLGKTTQAGFTFDFRTQSLDNLIIPHNGWKVSVTNRLYNKLLDSDFEYLRSDFQGDAYLATGSKADGTIHGFHFELDGGIEPTFGDTSEVPYTERFFQGGDSLRGFAFRGAGNRGTDVLGAPTSFAAGGESYVAGSVEWLYPLYSVIQPGTYRPIESLRGVLFFDWGALGDSAANLDLEDTRASVGFGVGLAYPLPIQLNFGFPIRRFAGDERRTFNFSIALSF